MTYWTFDIFGLLVSGFYDFRMITFQWPQLRPINRNYNSLQKAFPTNVERQAIKSIYFEKNDFLSLKLYLKDITSDLLLPILYLQIVSYNSN